jgi:hypothetical protein
MSALDCSWRESVICHLLVSRLDVQWPDCYDRLLTQRRADVFCEQTLITLERFAADPRFDGLELLIEVLIQPNLRAVSLNVGAKFIDLLSEKLLCLAQRAMNSTVVIAALFGMGIATPSECESPRCSRALR